MARDMTYEIIKQTEGNGFRVFKVRGPGGIELKPISLKLEWFDGETEMHDYALQSARAQHEGLRLETADFQNGRYY